MADDARRIAAGHRLPEHEEVERRPRRLRLRDDVRRAASRAGRSTRTTPSHHRHRADGAEVLRPVDSRRTSMASRCSDSPVRCRAGSSDPAAPRQRLQTPPYMRIVLRVASCTVAALAAVTLAAVQAPAPQAPARDRESARRRADPRAAEGSGSAGDPGAHCWSSCEARSRASASNRGAGAARTRPRDHAAGTGGRGSPGGDAAAARRRRSARTSNRAWCALQARAGRLLAPAPRRRRPARRRPRVSDGRGARPHRSRSRRGAPADAGGARPGAAGRCGSGRATSRSSRSRRATARAAVDGPSAPDRRWSRRSTPAAT